MFNEKNNLQFRPSSCRFLLTFIIALGGFIFADQTVLGQTPEPSQTPDKVEINGFTVKSSIEIGGRYTKVDGSENKFKSDFNYKKGIRVFNSSFSMEDKEGKNRYFDSLMINTSGWGADPSGYARVNLEKTGGYRFTSHVRRVEYFNNLNNHALNEHTQNTRNNMGDFDLSILPQNEKIRFNIGYSYSKYTGPGFSTARNYRDDFATGTVNDAKSNDFRAGVQGKLLGFNLSFTQGYRSFIDKSRYILASPSIGNATADTTVYNSFSRLMPVNGEAFFSVFDINRTFAKKLDFTGRVVYSSTATKSSVVDVYKGRDNSNNFIDSDSYEIKAQGKRPQTRADLGISFRATDNFTISNTVSYDQFTVNGGEDYRQLLIWRNPAGVAQPNRFTSSNAYRVNNFKKFTNLFEGDYQFNNKVSFHLGYRYTRREVKTSGYDRSLVSINNAVAVNNPTLACPYTGVGSANPLILCENEENSTNTFIAGMKIKPTKNWVMFWDVEKGDADNVFTRIENYKFTNFRFRTRVTFDKAAVSLSAISKDNTNPAQSDTIPPIGFGPNVKSRIFSGTIDWNPIPQLSFNTGYTYTHQTSKTPIYIFRTFPPSTTSVRTLGRSEYYVRDNYAYVDAVLTPFRRVSIYASYRVSRDKGQGDIPLTDPYPILIGNSSTALLTPENLIFSYPMKLQSPEVRAVFRLNNNVDWNIGYQYFNYKERFQSVQDYKAHLPYTSLTIYFGGADR